MIFLKVQLYAGPINAKFDDVDLAGPFPSAGPGLARATSGSGAFTSLRQR